MILTMTLPFVLALGLVLAGSAEVLLLCQRELPTWQRFWRRKKVKYRDKSPTPGILDRCLELAKQTIRIFGETNNYETRRHIPSRKGQRYRREWEFLRFTAIAMTAARNAQRTPSIYKDSMWETQFDEPWSRINPERDKVQIWWIDEIRVKHETTQHDPPWSPIAALTQPVELPVVITEVLTIPGFGETLTMLPATTEGGSQGRNSVTFDTDSGPIGIDNRCSVCMSNDKGDFVGELTKTFKYINGFNGTNRHTVYEGTIEWNLEDDEGAVHTIQIPKSYYIPDGPGRLMSPQHWGQQAQALQLQDGEQDVDGTFCITFPHRVELWWDKGSRCKTIEIDEQNVFTMNLAPGYEEFMGYCTTIGYDATMDLGNVDTCSIRSDNTVITVMDASASTRVQRVPISEVSIDPELWCRDDDDEVVPSEGATQDKTSEGGDSHSKPRVSEGGASTTEVEEEDNDLNGIEEVEPVSFELDSQRRDPSAELLRFHYKFGHIPFRRLQAMASNGALPRRIADCDIPACPACLYGRATRKSKGRKGQRSIDSVVAEVKKPGDCVSVDVLVSSTPGLIAQMSGFLSKQRYLYACIFLDHYSDFGYTYMMKKQDGDSVLEAKRAFEEYCMALGVAVKHYHTDNGIFACKACKTNATKIVKGSPMLE